MVKKELTLKGSYKGVKNLSPMKDPDIIVSKIAGKTYHQNKLDIQQRADGNYFIYHSVNSLDNYGGRWYNTNIGSDKLSFTHNKKQLKTRIPEWEDWNTNTVKKKCSGGDYIYKKRLG